MRVSLHHTLRYCWRYRRSTRWRLVPIDPADYLLLFWWMVDGFDHFSATGRDAVHGDAAPERERGEY